MDRSEATCPAGVSEANQTIPKEPVTSKGGYRDYGPVTGNAPGALNPESCVSRKVMDSLGGETVA